jgi:hypothetical protein
MEAADSKVRHEWGEAIQPLPEGGVLLHIGPHKTGTTALQNSALKYRDELRRQGVSYLTAGERGNANYAARAIRGKPSQKLESQDSVPMANWTDLARLARAAITQRVFISGEGFADCNQAEVERIVSGLDPERVHVVLTLRPIAKILTSQWQQYIQNNMKRASLEEFLNATLDPAKHDPEVGFWRRHRHDRLAQRWCNAVGSKRVTIVVVDDRSPELIMHSFEDLLKLERGTLRSSRNLVNRSLTMAEVEAVRGYYRVMDELGFKSRVYRRGRSVRPALFLKEQRTPAPEEARIELPSWSIERIQELSREIVHGLSIGGYRVIGDLDKLVEVPLGSRSTHVNVPSDVAAYLAAGMVIKSGIARPKSSIQTVGPWAPINTLLDRFASRSRLGGAVVRRLKSVLRRVI